MNNEQLNQNVRLMSAVQKNNLQKVQELLTAGADVNCVNTTHKNETPLHVAVTASNARLVKLLLAKGANTEARNCDSKKPMDLCSILGEKEKKEIEAVFNEQFYRTKLLTMVLFRLLHDDQIEDFHLGSNLGEVGLFDDVVLRTCSNGQSRVYLLQANHREPTNFVKLSDFHISKYFDTYLKIRYMFKQTSDHAIFQGNYEETELKLIIFTPAVVNNCDQVHCENMNSKDIFYNKSSGKTIKIKCTSDLLELLIEISKKWHSKMKLFNKPSHDKHANIVKDFLEKVRIYSEQATEGELTGIVQRDIKVKPFIIFEEN